MSVNLLFVHSDVDDFKLPPSDFRVLMHLSRRGECFAAIPTIATICLLHPQTARSSIRRLEAHKVIVVDRRKGCTSLIKIRPFKDWQPYRKGYPTEKDTRVLDSVDTPPKRMQGDPTEKDIDEGYPIKGNPIKEIPKEDLFPVPNPLESKSEVFKEAWAKWLQYRQHIKGVKKLQPVSIQTQLNEVVQWTDDEFVAAVTKSIASGWRSLNRPRQNNFGKPKQSLPTQYDDGKF